MDNERLPTDTNPVILVVEEDAFMGAVLEDLLRAESYSVKLCAPSLDALNDTQPEVIIASTPSARFPGAAFIIACHGRWPIAKIIAIVPASFRGGPDATLVAECFRSGATYVLSKPFQSQDILQRVASLARRTE